MEENGKSVDGNPWIIASAGEEIALLNQPFFLSGNAELQLMDDDEKTLQDLEKELFDLFSEDTGIPVDVLKANALRRQNDEDSMVETDLNDNDVLATFHNLLWQRMAKIKSSN